VPAGNFSNGNYTSGPAGSSFIPSLIIPVPAGNFINGNFISAPGGSSFLPSYIVPVPAGSNSCHPSYISGPAGNVSANGSAGSNCFHPKNVSGLTENVCAANSASKPPKNDNQNTKGN